MTLLVLTPFVPFRATLPAAPPGRNAGPHHQAATPPGSTTCERLAEKYWTPHRYLLTQKAYHGPQLTYTCVSNSRVRFHRIRDFKQYRFSSIRQTSQPGRNHRASPRARCARCYKMLYYTSCTVQIIIYCTLLCNTKL